MTKQVQSRLFLSHIINRLFGLNYAYIMVVSVYCKYITSCQMLFLSYVITCRASNTGLCHYMGQHNPKNATPNCQALRSNISETSCRNISKCHTNMSNDLLLHLITPMLNPSSGSLHARV